MSADLSRLENLVESFPRQSIVVLGDFVVDRFVTGEISRVSREAPVLILRHRETEIVPGGGANAVNNLVSLGARVYPVGAVGDDESGRSLLAYFRRKRVNVSNVVRVPGRTTPLPGRLDAQGRAASPARRPRARRSPGGESAAKACTEGRTIGSQRIGVAGIRLRFWDGGAWVREVRTACCRREEICGDARFALRAC